MVGQDQLLRAGAVDDVGHPVVEIGCPAPSDGDAAHAQASPTFHLRKWFPTAVHRALTSRQRPVVVTVVQRWCEQMTTPANLTSAEISVSRSRLPAKDARVPRGARAAARGMRESSGVRSPWTSGPSYFGDARVRARQTVRFRRL